MFVFETFFATEQSTLALNVWADDTARVLIDALEVFGPNFTQDICAVGPIGCEPGDVGMITRSFTTGGLHTLTFEVFQVGGGPFGLLYAGEVSEPAEVPEPATLSIMGFGLLVLGLLRHGGPRANAHREGTLAI